MDLVVDLALQQRPQQRLGRALPGRERCVRVLREHRLLVLEAQPLGGAVEVLGLQLPEAERTRGRRRGLTLYPASVASIEPSHFTALRLILS